MSIDFPEIEEGQYAVLFVELDTGIVLNVNFKRATGQDERWTIFNSFKEAEDFSWHISTENPKVECSIYDFSKKYIETINRNGIFSSKS